MSKYDNKPLVVACMIIFVVGAFFFRFSVILESSEMLLEFMVSGITLIIAGFIGYLYYLFNGLNKRVEKLIKLNKQYLQKNEND